MLTDRPYAAIQWDDGDVPRSRQFGDVYFDARDGLAEAIFVFCENNKLQNRFNNCECSFFIGETGFGSGLNFLAAAALFAGSAPVDTTLYFESVERYPLHPADMARALRRWPDVAPLAHVLLQHYRPYSAEPIIFSWQQRHYHLHIAYVDANEYSFINKKDAWFLDGFAPARNPQLWQEGILQQIAAASREGTTVATFTAARKVLDGLSAAGFAMEKVAGYGRKRAMLRGVWRG